MDMTEGRGKGVNKKENEGGEGRGDKEEGN